MIQCWSKTDIPKLRSAEHQQVLRKEIGKKNQCDKIWKLWICAAMNCVQVSTWWKLFSSCSVPWSSVHSKYYRPKCTSCVSWVSFARPFSRNHAKHRERAHLVFLRTFSQLRQHSVKVENNQVAMQWYLLLSAFSACFSIEVFFYTTTFGSSVFRTKQLPVAGF